MSITFDKNSNIFQLNTKTTSYLIGIADDQYVGHIYYGKKLNNCQGGYALLRTEEKPFVPSENVRDKAAFADAFPYEYSTHGVGDYRESCLSVRTPQGYRSCELIYRDYRIFDGKPELPGLPATFVKDGDWAHRYILGVYELQERLVTEFPDLLLENCASGGGRFDPGMLYYSPQIWCSDDTDAVERLAIQEGTALLYPLSCMGAHVSACPNHIVGRNTPFETRGHVALDGTFGYELDITKLSTEEKEKVKKQIELYHRYDHLVREGIYYRIASWQENHLYDCWEVAAKDQSEAVVTYVQVLAGANMRSRKIRLKGLDEGALHRLEGTEKVFGGQMLMYGGVLVESQEGDYVSRVMHFVRG